MDFIMSVLAGITFIIALLFGGLPPLCENDVEAVVDSPDAQYEAVVFLRSCGATTGYSTQIALTPKGAESFYDDKRIILILDGDMTESKVIASWPSQRRLRVAYDKDAEMFRMVRRIDDIDIEYDPK